MEVLTLTNGVGPGRSSGKVLGFWLDGPGSIPSVGRVDIFLRVQIVPQPPIKSVPGTFPRGKVGRA